MGLIERAFEKSGIEQSMESPNYPAMGKRRNRDWAALIGTARKLESQGAEMRERLMSQNAELAAKNAELTERLAQAAAQIQSFKLKERISQAGIGDDTATLLLEA